MDSEEARRAGVNTPAEYTPEAVGIIDNDLVAKVPYGMGLFGAGQVLILELQAGARYRFGPGNTVLVESIVVRVTNGGALQPYICQRGWRNAWEPETGGDG